MYFIFYQQFRYEGQQEHIASTEDEMLAFVNDLAARNPELWVRVIRGEEVKLEPATIVKAYVVKK